MATTRVRCPPPEVLLEICRLVQPSDTLPLLQASKSFNELISPTLYSSVILKYPSSAKKWIRTMSRPANELYGTRELAHLVRRLDVDKTLSRSTFAHSGLDEIKIGFAQVLPRLVYLRELRIRCPSLVSIDVLADFVRISQGKLCTLDVILVASQHRHVAFRGAPPVPSYLPLNNLTIVKINGIWGFSAGYIHYLQCLLTFASQQIHTLSLSNSDELLAKDIIGSETSFPALTSLEVDVAAFFLRKFPHAAFPRVRELILRGDESGLNFDIRDGKPLRSLRSAYPMLESLSCEEPFLPVLLRGDVPSRQRRPIHTVKLNDATYGVDETYDGIEAEWPLLAESLESLSNSGAPVRHLSFAVDEVKLAELASLLRRFTSLETLVIATRQDIAFEHDYEVERVSQMLAKMPRLHTLLFSDVMREPFYASECSPVARSRTKQRDKVDRWSQRGVSLRRIAFTVMMEWVRGGDGWELVDRSEEGEIVTDSEASFGADSEDDYL